MKMKIISQRKRKAYSSIFARSLAKLMTILQRRGATNSIYRINGTRDDDSDVDNPLSTLIGIL